MCILLSFLSTMGLFYDTFYCIGEVAWPNTSFVVGATRYSLGEIGLYGYRLIDCLSCYNGFEIIFPFVNA